MLKYFQLILLEIFFGGILASVDFAFFKYRNNEVLLGKLWPSPAPCPVSPIDYSVLENNRITSADLTFPNRNWSVPVLVLSLLSPVCQQTRDLCFSLDSQREGFITCKDSRRLSLMMMMLTSQTTLDTDTGITAEWFIFISSRHQQDSGIRVSGVITYTWY